MALKAGEKAVLVGPSGCGKSTVLRCLLGFVVPGAGSVYIEGEQLTAGSVWKLRRHLAYVGQEPELGSGTVRQILERPFHFHANAALRGNLGRSPELFERFGLTQQLMDKDTADLSGGEKQRIALISALLLDRRIILLDEITSALDKARTAAVLDYFRARDDLTVLFIAHDAEGFAFADQVIPLHQNAPSHGEA